MELMYPKNNKTGILEVLKIKTFFAALLDRLFVKFSPQILHWWHLCKVIKKSKNDLIYLSTITWLLEISEENKKL